MKRLIAVFAIAFAVVTGSVTTTVLSSPQAKAEHVLHCFYLRLTKMRRLMNVRLLTPRVDVRQRTWLASRPYNATTAGYDNYMKLHIS